MFEFIKIIRKFILNIFYRRLNIPTVSGYFTLRKYVRNKPKVIYADQFFTLSKELYPLRHSDLRSAEVHASNKGDIYLYSYIAPARYGVRAWYGKIIGLISFILSPLWLSFELMKCIWGYVYSTLEFSLLVVIKVVPIILWSIAFLFVVGIVLYLVL
jgi:hypothetical protein